MSRSRTHRPRLTYDTRDRVIELSSILNGKEVESFHEGLQLLLRYFEALEDNVECPECGAADVETRSKSGLWHCWRCEEDTESGLFNITDYLDVANEEDARLLGTPRSITYEFRCDREHVDDQAGTNDSDSVRTVENQPSYQRRSVDERWRDGP